MAVKVIDGCDQDTLLAVRRELQVLTKIEHPHVLALLGFVTREPPLRILLEFCDGGTLFNLLHNCYDVQLSWPQKLKVLVDTASAMEYLHNFTKQIIHRDLKSLNIFLQEEVMGPDCEPMVKVADFGSARMRDRFADGRAADWSTPTQGVGSMHWMAPEVYQGGMYHHKADVFSFAFVTYEVVCREVPFGDLAPTMAGAQIARGSRPNVTAEVVPADTPPDVLRVMFACWEHKQENRPDFHAIHTALKYVLDLL